MPPERTQNQTLKKYVKEYIEYLKPTWKIDEIIAALEHAKEEYRWQNGTLRNRRRQELRPKETLLLCYALDYNSKPEAIEHCKSIIGEDFSSRNDFSRAFNELLSETINSYTGYLVEEYEQENNDDLINHFPIRTIQEVERRVSHWPQIKNFFQLLGYYKGGSYTVEIRLTFSVLRPEEQEEAKENFIENLKDKFPWIDVVE